MTLTTKQSAILAYIRTSIASRGYPPTVREIGKHMGIRSPNGVMGHLIALQKHGAIVREAGKSRAIRVVEQAPSQEAGQ
jgi:repressor LexA